jgi:hypothetical protein
MTGDESSLYLETGHSAQWFVCHDNVATKAKLMIDIPKVMLMVMRGTRRFHVVNLMTSQNWSNSQYFREHIMMTLVQGISAHGRNQRVLQLHLDLYNSRVHFSTVTEPFFAANDILRIPHPPSSQTVVSPDFWLFGRMKSPPSPGSHKCWTQFRSRN